MHNLPIDLDALDLPRFFSRIGALQSPDLDKDLKSASSSLNSSMESLPSSNGSTTGSQEADDFVSTSKHEDTIFRGIGTYLLPKVGTSVSTLILSASRGITSSHVRSMLRQLPNVRYKNDGTKPT